MCQIWPHESTFSKLFKVRQIVFVLIKNIIFHPFVSYICIRWQYMMSQMMLILCQLLVLDTSYKYFLCSSLCSLFPQENCQKTSSIMQNTLGKLKDIFHFTMFFLLKMMNIFGRLIRLFSYITNGIVFKNRNFDKK